MDKLKEFVLKYKVTLSIIVLLGASFLIYFLVSANEDPYENMVEVKETNVTIEDGTPNVDGNFDSNDEAGNDSSDSNHIVRNFDSIIYNIEYTLGFKDGIEDGDTSSDTTRNVIIDVLIPESLKADVSSELTSSPEGYEAQNVTINGVKYKYYELTYIDSSLINSNVANVVLSNINSKNGETILPIIRVRESTDKNVNSVFDTEDISSMNNVLTTNDIITVSAADKLAVKLYSGTIKSDKTTGITGVPIGIVLYIPNDSNKGIKGVQVPNAAEYNLDIKYTEGSGSITYLDRGDYDETRFTVPNLPNSYIGGTNANIGYEEVNTTEGYNKTYKLKFENINYNNNAVNLNDGIEDSSEEVVTYVSSNIFAINSEKIVNKDATLEFKLGDSITHVLDNYEPFVGDYLSKIDFINSSNIEVNTGGIINFEAPGEAAYNYSEEFYIQNTISYAEHSGDVLKGGLTNYIKIDNSMVKLINVGNMEDQTLEYYLNITSSNENQNTNIASGDIYKVSYGIGEWNPNNFKIKSNAPSYCPKSTSKLTKDALMNYYGGPCIEEIEGKIKWYDSIDLAAADDENNRNKIIVFKYEFTDDYYPATKTIIRLKGKMVSNISNVGKTTQIVSRGTTIEDDNLYYLSQTPRKSVSIQDQDLNYIKTEYKSNHELQDGTNLPSGKYGNTILVTPFKVSLNDIEIRDKNNSLKSTIYSGITDPISIKISPSLYKSDPNATFVNLKVTIYLPIELELTTEKKDKTLTYIGQETVNGRMYNKYEYIYSENNIKYGTASVVDSLILHAYVDISAQDLTNSTIFAKVDATMKTNQDAITTFSSNISEIHRTKSTSITLRNTNVISTIGKMASSIYFDKNGEMVYNMRAANISGGETNLSLVKVVPYSGDALGDGSEFDGTISIRLSEALPSGYEIYYTKENSKTIINNELNSTASNKWIKWENYTKNTAGITAIKIVATNKIPNNGYFVSKSGINLIMKTSENNEGNEYYNNFYILNAGKCNNKEECNQNSDIITPVASNITYASVYNRSISGYVFEDYDYNGLYGNSEKRLSDIVVEIYKLKNQNGNINIEEDELISETITDKRGYYNFKGLGKGKYYIKYTYDCDKYTLTKKNKTDINIGDTSNIDSDAQIVQGTCNAVSNIITLDNNNINENHIDMGLRIKQNFGVNIKKYITNVVVNSNRGTQVYDYNNESKVKIDVKNLKNTSFRVTYKFEIENSKYFPGTIGTIVETIPEGMTFDSTLASNDGWYESGGKLYYSKLAGTLILPEEKYYMTIVLDLKTDNGGTYINFVAAQDLKVMDISTNLLEGVIIADYDNQTNDTSSNDEEQE